MQENYSASVEKVSHKSSSILLTNFYNGWIVKTQHVAAYEITRKEVTSMFKSIILHNRTALTILTVKTRTNRILPSDFCTHS